MAKASTNSMAIMPANSIETPIEQLKLSENEYATLRKSESRIAASTAQIQRLDREISSIRTKIAELELSRQLKKLKADKKLMTSIQRDAASTYNGALEMALSDSEGNSLQEKIRNLKQNRLEAAI